MKGEWKMRFVEKAKKLVSMSMIVCMFVLAFGMMTAYAYSYLKFGGGFGFGAYGSYGSYGSSAKIRIAKRWDDRLGIDEHSQVVINYSAGSVEDSVTLGKDNGWNSGEIEVPAENGSVVFSISEDPVPDGYTAIYVVDCEKTYSLFSDEEEEGASSEDSGTGEETQPDEEEAATGSDDKEDGSEADPENDKTDGSESETEDVNEPASDDSNISESDQENESDSEIQSDDTEQEPEPSEAELPEAELPEEEAALDTEEEEMQTGSSLAEEEDAVTYKKESVFTFGGLSIVSMSVEAGSVSDGSSSSSNESGNASSSSSSSNESSNASSGSSSSSESGNASSGSSSSNESGNASSGSSSSNESGSDASGGSSSNESGSASDESNSSSGTDSSDASDSNNTSGETGSNNGSSNESGDNVSDTDNNASNKDDNAASDGNGDADSGKDETVDAPDNTEALGNSGADKTEDDSTSDKVNDDNSAIVSNPEDEAADSQNPADDNLYSDSGSQGGSGGSGSGTGSSKEEAEEEDEIDSLDGELEAETPPAMKDDDEKRAVLTVELDDVMCDKTASYKDFTLQLMQEGKPYGSEVDLLGKEEYTWEDIPLFDGDSKYEYELKTKFSFSVEANEKFSLPEDSDVQITVINTRLEIGKTVAGDAADAEQEFSFTITLRDEDGNELDGSYEYGGSKEGTISSGDTITLKHGQFVFVKDLPKGTKWKVEEAETDYIAEVKIGDVKTEDDEAIRIAVAEGSIGENSSNVQFTNTKNDSKGDGGNGGNGGGNGGGGGGNGGGGGSSRSGGSTPDPQPQPEEIIELPEEEVPLAAFMPELPKTGDDSGTVLYLVFCLASLGSAALLIASQRRKYGR